MSQIDDYIKEHGYLVFPTRKEYEDFERMLIKSGEGLTSQRYEPLAYNGIVVMYCDHLFYSDGRTYDKTSSSSSYR